MSFVLRRTPSSAVSGKIVKNVVDMLRAGRGDLLVRADGAGELEQGLALFPRRCNSFHGVRSPSSSVPPFEEIVGKKQKKSHSLIAFARLNGLVFRNSAMRSKLGHAFEFEPN